MPMRPFRAPNPWADAPPVQEAVQEEESASPEPGSLGGRGLRRGQTIHQLQSDVNSHEHTELRRLESGAAAPQPVPAVYQAPPPGPAFAAAAQHGSFMSTQQATMQWPPPCHGGPRPR